MDYTMKTVAVSTGMSDDPPLSEKLKLNQAIIESFNTGPADPKVVECVADHYYQHNLLVPNGKSAYSQAVGGIFEASKNPGAPPLSSKVIRAFSDPSGPFTFFHVQYDFFGPKAGFDVCRWEDGKIVEHWDNLAPMVTESVNGNTMFDGPQTSSTMEMHRTEANKKLVKDFTFNVLLCARLDQLDKYVSDDLIQHDPTMHNGKAALKEHLQKLADKGATYLLSAKPVLVGEADFVIATGEQRTDPLDDNSPMASHWDMYRLAGGKIAEHWNTIEALMPEEKRAHKNGKW